MPALIRSQFNKGELHDASLIFNRCPLQSLVLSLICSFSSPLLSSPHRVFTREIMIYCQYLWSIKCELTIYLLILRFQCYTTEAAKLEAEVTKAQDTITAAQQLISQLDGEHTRWNAQVVWCMSVLMYGRLYTFTEKGTHLPCKSNRRCVCVCVCVCDRGMYPAVLSPFWLFLLLSTASVCALIKTLNLWHTHTHTRAHTPAHPHTHCLPQGPRQRASLLSTHVL